MQVRNFLTAVFTAVDNEAVAVFSKSEILCEFLGSENHLADESGIFVLDFVYCRNNLVRHNKDMYFSFRTDILECGYLIILINNFRWNFMFDYF